MLGKGLKKTWQLSDICYKVGGRGGVSSIYFFPKNEIVTKSWEVATENICHNSNRKGEFLRDIWQKSLNLEVFKTYIHSFLPLIFIFVAVISSHLVKNHSRWRRVPWLNSLLGWRRLWTRYTSGFNSICVAHSSINYFQSKYKLYRRTY